MKIDLLGPLQLAAQTVLQAMCATEPVPGSPSTLQQCEPFGAVSGSISMKGQKASGTLIISFDEASILGIVNRMLSESYQEINQDVLDAVGELTNMICGGAKVGLGEQGLDFEFARPEVHTSEQGHLLNGRKVLRLPFSTPDGVFVMETDIGEIPS